MLEPMSWNRFHDIGLQQEINRRVLHPIGFDLQLYQLETGNLGDPAVFSTDDPDGFLMSVDRGKKAGVEIIENIRHVRRRSKLGFIIQEHEDLRPLLTKIRAYLARHPDAVELSLELECAYHRLT